MKNLRFESISLLSLRTRKGRKVTFHPKRNLILGMNHTGKSTLTKMLFETLGTKPSGRLDGWERDVVCSLEIRVGDSTYTICRQGERRALFDDKLSLLCVFKTAGEWSRRFRTLVGFNLALTDKQEKDASADPACFFLPFYINQDASWGGKWDTFQGIARFKSPVKPILDFFSEILPSAYYEAKAAKDELEAGLRSLEDEQKLLRRARARMGKSISVIGPKLSADDFQAEIERLTREVNLINQRQETLRLYAIRLQDTISKIDLEINAAGIALADFDRDREYMRKGGIHDLRCPTCNSEQQENFLAALQYSEDARSVEDTLLQLRDTRRELIGDVEKSFIERQQLGEDYRRLSELLQSKKGEMTFGELVETLGASNALTAFDIEDQDLEAKQAALAVLINERRKEMASFQDRQRAIAINRQFRDAYAANLLGLNVTIEGKEKLGIAARPSISGSGEPRAVLAYYAALWSICLGDGTPATTKSLVPVVIDCPNQQGQDDVNLPAILRFIGKDLKLAGQLVVNFENDVNEPFDKKINLTGERSLLREDAFQAVNSEVEPILKKMYEGLLSA